MTIKEKVNQICDKTEELKKLIEDLSTDINQDDTKQITLSLIYEHCMDARMKIFNIKNRIIIEELESENESMVKL